MRLSAQALHDRLEEQRLEILEAQKEALRAGEEFLAAQAYICELQRRINSNHRYIQELEKQLEYCNPGIVKEVQEFLEGQEVARA